MYEDDVLLARDLGDGYAHGCIELLCGEEVSLFNILNDACNHPRQVLLLIVGCVFFNLIED